MLLGDHIEKESTYIITLHFTVYFINNTSQHRGVLYHRKVVFLKYFSSFQQSYLKKYLKKDKINVAMAASGDAIPKTFLMSLVKLIGRC